MQFFFSPVLGVLSDRFGRRPVLLLSSLGLGLDYIVMALSPTLGWLLVGRVISGITTSSIPTAMAYIADVTPKEKRAGAFGIIGVAFGIGFTLGPGIGGIVGQCQSANGILGGSGSQSGNWLYGYLFVPESLIAEHRKAFTWRRANPVGSLAIAPFASGFVETGDASISRLRRARNRSRSGRSYAIYQFRLEPRAALANRCSWSASSPRSFLVDSPAEL